MGSVSTLSQSLTQLKRRTMKTLSIFACLLAVVIAAEKAATDDKTVQVAESADQLPAEQRYGGSRGGYGGRRYGRSVADETQELEVEEQRYGGYRGGYGGHRYGRSVHRYGGYHGGYGGHRYGRSVADETQELEGQEQRYGGYRGGHGGHRYGRSLKGNGGNSYGGYRG